MSRTRIRARELRPGDVVIEGWDGVPGSVNGRWTVGTVHVAQDDELLAMLGRYGWAEPRIASLRVTPFRMIATQEWPGRTQGFLPHVLDPSQRVTVERDDA